MGSTAHHHNAPALAGTYGRLTVFAAVFLAAVLGVVLLAFLAAGADFLALGLTVVARAMADCATACAAVLA